MEDRPQKTHRASISKWWYLAAGLLLGALLILAIRYATYSADETHYHANFAVYVDGEREQFKGQQYYQEVKLCSLHGNKLTPPARVHMHNKENGVIHVHDDAVTWGQFFANLGWVIGPDFIRTSEGLLTSGDEKQLRIVLNDQDLTGISSIVNQQIDDKDRLLVSYGSEDQATVKEQFETVPSNAGDYNSRPDPASCGGVHKVTPSERLRNLF